MSAHPSELNPGGSVPAGGFLGLTVIRGGQAIPIDPHVGLPAAPGDPLEQWVPAGQRPRLRDYMPHYMPRRGLSDEVNEYRTRNLPNIYRGAKRVAAAGLVGVSTFYGALWLKKLRDDEVVTDYGLVSLQLVTTAGVTYICADIAGGGSDSNLFKFHGFGTGTTAESTSDTALVTELTTQYATDNTRPTGSQSASTNTYTTVGTLTPDADVAITEHGIFTAITAGTLLDRTKFSAINLVAANPDSLQATYVFTLPAGG